MYKRRYVDSDDGERFTHGGVRQEEVHREHDRSNTVDNAVGNAVSLLADPRWSGTKQVKPHMELS